MRGKTELAKQKKKLEGDVKEVEAALEAANRALSEAGKTNGKLRQLLGEQQSQVEDQERQKGEMREAVVAADRKVSNLMVELDEFRSALELNDRARKAAEQDVHEAGERVNELNAANTLLAAHKRKLESDVGALRAELDDALVEAKNAQEMLHKSYGDVSRHADELKYEQVRIHSRISFEDFSCKLYFI